MSVGTARINITRKGIGPKQFWSVFWMEVGGLEERLVRLSNDTRNTMINRIKTMTKRAPANRTLARAIHLYKPFEIGSLSNQFIAAVGNEDYMYKHAKYWYVINYGMTRAGKVFTPPYTRGSFGGEAPRPGTGGKTRLNKDGQFLIKPKKAITPFHYIESGNKYARINFEKTILRWAKVATARLNSLGGNMFRWK